MKLFGQIVRTVVNVTTLPVDVMRDLVDPKPYAWGSHTAEALERLKREAAEQKRTKP
jgi:hypothetical protein